MKEKQNKKQYFQVVIFFFDFFDLLSLWIGDLIWKFTSYFPWNFSILVKGSVVKDITKGIKGFDCSKTQLQPCDIISNGFKINVITYVENYSYTYQPRHLMISTESSISIKYLEKVDRCQVLTPRKYPDVYPDYLYGHNFCLEQYIIFSSKTYFGWGAKIVMWVRSQRLMTLIFHSVVWYSHCTRNIWGQMHETQIET